MWDINSRANHGTALAGRGLARGSAAAIVALVVSMDFLACLAGASDSATGGRWLVRMEDTADAWRACEEGSLGLGAEMGVVRFEGGRRLFLARGNDVRYRRAGDSAVVPRLQGHLDALEVHVECSPQTAVSIETREQAARVLARDIKNNTGVTLSVRVHDPGSMERSAGKARRLVDPARPVAVFGSMTVLELLFLLAPLCRDRQLV
jgi:hypothetical protein